MTFEEAVAIIIHHEGGATITDDPADPGGLTKYGISQRAHPDVDIRGLTYAQAAEIYRRDYWDRLRCGDMPAGIDLAVFDCGVNQGVGFAAKAIQRDAGARPDGIVGPLTLAAIARRHPEDLLTDFMARRMKRYASVSHAPRFMRGWSRRCFDIHRRAVIDQLKAEI